MTQLSAEVDSLKQTISSHTKDHTCLKNTLTRVTEQKDYLLRTQVMYEHDKRELEQELTAKQKETEKEAAEKLLLKKMKGFVSHEKDKFDRLSKQMQRKQKEIRVKNEKLRQVEELIKNSPLPACSGESVRTPLRDTGLPNTDVSIISAFIGAILTSLFSCLSRMLLFSLVLVGNARSLKTGWNTNHSTL